MWKNVFGIIGSIGYIMCMTLAIIYAFIALWHAPDWADRTYQDHLLLGILFWVLATANK